MSITTVSLPHLKNIAALYRRAIRLTQHIEGQRRRRLCVFRTKSMLSEALQKAHTDEDMRKHLLDVDVYLDQLESQAVHLRTLDAGEKIIPLKLQGDVRASKLVLDSLPGLRRSLQNTNAPHAGHLHAIPPNKLFKGPEPSWIRNGKVKQDHGWPR